MATQPRTINRGANPFAPMVIQQNVNLAPTNQANIYEPLTVRGARAHTNSHVQEALKNLRTRLGGEKYTHKHFGELIWAKISDLDINIEIQRDEDAEVDARADADRGEVGRTQPAGHHGVDDAVGHDRELADQYRPAQLQDIPGDGLKHGDLFHETKAGSRVHGGYWRIHSSI